MFDISGKTAVVTGGGGVICKAIAKALASKGTNVALLDLSLASAQAVADEINDGGGNAIAAEVNVLERESVEKAAAEVKEKFERIDILINGAGGNHPKATTGEEQTFFDLPLDAVRWVFDLNFIGTLLPTQVFGKIMAEQKNGNIINIASMASFRPLTKTIAYSASKAAIVNYTQWMSVHFCREYSPNIRVNAIAPGFLLTKQNEYLMLTENKELTPRGAAVIDNTPMNRFGDPSELSGSVIFLCSDAASFVTGAVLPIDGGFNAFSGV
jgi:NAD(P)-dependent dehydrogenase (short-subunit alcohol dehydrogenase family)